MSNPSQHNGGKPVLSTASFTSGEDGQETVTVLVSLHPWESFTVTVYVPLETVMVVVVLAFDHL